LITISEHFSNPKKIKILQQGKSQLEKEATTIVDSIHKDVAELIKAKGASFEMNSALAKYELKLKKSQMSKLKLSDMISMKKQLAKKLTKEIDGFRTSASSYKDLRHLNPNDIKRVVKEIKSTLGY